MSYGSDTEGGASESVSESGATAGTGSAGAFGSESYGSEGGMLGGLFGGMFGGSIGSAIGKGIGTSIGGSMTGTHDLGGTYGEVGGGGLFGGGDGGLSSLLNLSSGLYGALGQGDSNSAQDTADPFGRYRSGLAASYNAALQPGATLNLQGAPGYTQFNTGVLKPAMQASQRQAAATGKLYSGNEQIALQKMGQEGYYGFMTDYLNRLAQGSGAVNNPANSAQLGLTQRNQDQQGVMQGIGAIGQGISGLSNFFSGSTPTPTDMTGFRSDYSPIQYSPMAPDTSSLGSGNFTGDGGYNPDDIPWFGG